MIDAQGHVTAIDGDYAIIRMDDTGCGRCHEHGGCGGNNIGKMFCSTPRVFRVLNPGNSIIGDCVQVVIADGAVRRSAAVAYGTPLLAMLVGAIGGDVLAGETGSIIGAFCCLFAAWIGLRRAHLSGAHDQRFQPHIRT
jgi:sigma-E factor negative regulatory protein RseC